MSSTIGTARKIDAILKKSCIELLSTSDQLSPGILTPIKYKNKIGATTSKKNSTAPSISFLEEYIVLEITKAKSKIKKVKMLNPIARLLKA